MKKTLITLMVIAGLSSFSEAAQITWANNTEIYDWSGASNLVLDSYTNYIVRLYESVDATINFGISGGIATVSGDDTWTGYEFNWNSQGADGFGADVISASDATWGMNSGDKIYSVIFSTSPSAGYFAIIDNSLASVAYVADNMSYDPGGVAGGLQGAGGDWQAIPEPATFLLFGMGGMGAWLIRRKSRMSV